MVDLCQGERGGGGGYRGRDVCRDGGGECGGGASSGVL